MQNKKYLIAALTAGMITVSLTAVPVLAESEEEPVTEAQTEVQTEASTEISTPDTPQLAFSICDTPEKYVYVFADADRDSEIIGKLYTYSYVDIIEELEYDWTHISSGHVNGYVDTTAIHTGEIAQQIADETGYTTAQVQVDELNVYADTSTDSEVIATAKAGDVLESVQVTDEWVKVVLVGEDGGDGIPDEDGEDDGLIYGWVAADKVNVRTEYRLAVTLEEDELGLIDVGEDAEEPEEEEYYEEPSYQQPTYTQPTYTQPTYTQPASQPETQASQPETKAAQPETQASQPETKAAADTSSADDDEIYEDDGSGDDIYNDDEFDDTFYDAD